MIPRFKPYLGKEELAVLFKPNGGTVERFEKAFADAFEARYAIAFPYGRSALWAFFKALGVENAEIIMPAYTCVVVAHAIVLSGNIPRFVDVTLYDYNMDLDQVEAAVNDNTRAIVATHLFGYPLNVDRLKEIVRDAETKYGHKVWIIQDCAHAFGARWNGKLVCNEGDAAIFGLNISKTITSIFGGMLTTNDEGLADRLRKWRDQNFRKPGSLKALKRRIYLIAAYFAFNESIYSFVNWLEEKTPLLDRLTKAYHVDGKIHFPPDYMDKMLDVEAGVGLEQLRKYHEIIRKREANAKYYDQQLRDRALWQLPPIIDGATYSHYVVISECRSDVILSLIHI